MTVRFEAQRIVYVWTTGSADGNHGEDMDHSR